MIVQCVYGHEYEHEHWQAMCEYHYREFNLRFDLEEMKAEILKEHPELHAGNKTDTKKDEGGDGGGPILPQVLPF